MPTVFPSLKDWRRDASTEPTVRSSRGYRVEVTPGRVARAERLLHRDDDPEHVAAITGLPVYVVNQIADRLATEEVEAEDAAEPIRHQRRREWIELLTAWHLRDSHLVLLQIAERYFHARRFFEAWTLARLAVVLLLRGRWFVMSGANDTTIDDPDVLLRKIRSAGGIDRQALRAAREAVRYRHRKMHDRANETIASVRALHQLLGDFGEEPLKA